MDTLERKNLTWFQNCNFVLFHFHDHNNWNAACCDLCSYFQSTSEPKLVSFYHEVKFSTDNFHDEDGKRILIASSLRNICVHIVQPDGTLAFEQTNYFSTKTLSIQMLLKLDRPIQGYFCPPQYLSWPLSRLFLTCAISVDIHLEYSFPRERY